MPRYRFRIRDIAKRVLAEDDIDEHDAVSACRAVTFAIVLFISSHGAEGGAMIELDDPDGTTIDRMSLDGKPQARLTALRLDDQSPTNE